MGLVAGFDLETTGLSQPDGHRIIEVAFKLYDSVTHEAKGMMIQRINPERSIDAKAQRVHGIAFEDLVLMPKWDAVAPKLNKLFSAVDGVVAHNGIGFDMPFIRGEMMRVGLIMPNVFVIDTMLDARWATPHGKSPNLGELCYALDVDYDPAKAHSAEYDVDVMMACYFEGLKQGFFQAIPPRQSLAKAA